MSDVLHEIRGQVGFITLNRPKALNALSLGMIRELTALLLAWRDDAAVHAVAVRGQGRDGPFGAFCAGGDIRFFHQAALQGDPSLEDFFTEEYTLNHLVHHYPKPYVAFMDGVVMGGGMGLCQGAAVDAAPAAGQVLVAGARHVRLVTERTKMAMPETGIGLFPDVGGGHFLSRCPGHVGEYLALTGRVIDGAQAVGVGLADRLVQAAELPRLWNELGQGKPPAEVLKAAGTSAGLTAWADGTLDRVFGLASVAAIVAALEGEPGDWAAETLAVLRKRSPLMLNVVLAQVRRARGMSLADELRMERGLVRHCFHTAHLARQGAASETVEGIRALAVDKDHSPRWNPARIEDVTPAMVAPFFDSPWPAHAHPLRNLA